MSRRTTAVISLVVVIGAAAGGWILGQQVTSPAEIAARTEAPVPSPILVPLESRVLSTDIVTRGTGRFGSPLEITLPRSRFKPETGVVTDLSPAGTDVDEGEALLSVSGRPVVLAKGELPSYRDLGIGMVGDDIAQLEAMLDRRGFRPGQVDGRFDERTAAAVRRLTAALDVPVAVGTPALIAATFGEPSLFDETRPAEGVLVPADEIVFVPTLPVRVAEHAVDIGDALDGPVVTVTDATVVVDSSVPVEQAGLIAVGMSVRLDEPDLGIEATGTISAVATGPGTDGVDGFHVAFQIAVDGVPTSIINASVRVTIPIDSTSSEVLTAPIAALSLAPDGTSRLHVDRSGTLEPVEVRPGLSAQGMVELDVLRANVTAGDLVLVGFENPVAPSG